MFLKSIELKEKIKTFLVEFCRQTSIHGFWYIQRGVCWIAWALFAKLMIGFCLWQCVLNIKEYYSFKVRTTMRTNVFQTLEFPAISFSTQIPYKASGFGNILGSYYIASILTTNKTRIPSLAKEVRKFCSLFEQFLRTRFISYCMLCFKTGETQLQFEADTRKRSY